MIIVVVNQTSSIPNSDSDGDLSYSDLDHWLISANSLLDKITTLEVNTTIVSEIRDEVFLAWEAYQDIYAISRTHLQEVGIPPELCDLYLDLRRQLELKYALRAINPNCAFYDSVAKENILKVLPILKRFPDSSWENFPTLLPSPFAAEKTAEHQLLSKILKDKSFLRLLRQLSKKKAHLDRVPQTGATNNNKDITYAQTVIELEGTISNYYAQEILHHPDKKTILILHQQGVTSAEKQWYRLLKFALSIIQKQQTLRKS